jgi:hypothetical protein
MEEPKCSRWSRAVQLKWMSQAALGEPKDAETEEQRVWTNLEQASHNEDTFTVAETDLGELQNWRALVGNRRHKLLD